MQKLNIIINHSERTPDRKNILEKIIFPLGSFDTKEQIRDIARKYNLSIASKPDSQDICFIPNNNYIEFLEKNNIEFKKGNIVDMKENVLGQHTGLHRYTIGQRRGDAGLYYLL